ncbi:MAG: glycerophosphodiester phosphodiesterase [Clostridiales Family XIII bacterium]|jgi:glycerophosphoryl diester phosphodiesterase|nr:glycerophosphodiester phosphodiesterase [Clostridiales Family XIII bacterium]
MPLDKTCILYPIAIDRKATLIYNRTMHLLNILDWFGKKQYRDTTGGDIAWIRNRPIAHRGLHDPSRPENSIPAFEAAIAENVCIEFDVQRSADGKFLVFHDENLRRMTGLDAIIHETPYSVIKDLRLAGTGYGIPLLEDVLELVAGKVPLLVEVKRHDKIDEEKVTGLLHAYKSEYDGKFAIQSFHPLVVKYMQKLSPEFFCGLLSSNFKNNKALRINKAGIKNARLFFLAKPDFISFEINSFPNKRIAKFRDKGLLVLGWTVMTSEEIEKAKVFCDNIILEKTKLPNILEVI